MPRPEIAVYSVGDSERRKATAKEAGANYYFDKFDDYENLREWIRCQDGKVVVVVDDNESLLSQITMRLELAGATVHRFSNPLEALEQIPSLSPDSLLTDVDMPEMTGIDLVNRLGKIYSRIE